MLWDKITKAVAIAGGVVAGLFGGWDTMLIVLVAFMVIDFVTGWMVAFAGKSLKTVSGHLDSDIARKGLMKKAGELLLVIVAVMLDMLAQKELGYNSAIFRTPVMLFIVATEGLSILENLGLLDVPLPAFIMKALEQLKNKTNNGTMMDLEPEKKVEEHAAEEQPATEDSEGTHA